MSQGTLTLHHFGEEEIFAVSEATVRYFVGAEKTQIDFQVSTERTPLKSLTATETLRGWPNGQWQLSVLQFDPQNLVGQRFVIPLGYEEESQTYKALFYYTDHQEMDNNTITVLESNGQALRVEIVGTIPDVDTYDGTASPTRVRIEATFALLEESQPIRPVG